MRSTLDKLISWTGLVLAAVLVVAGGLLVWANSFISANVSEQLRDQQITMPAGEALDNPDIKPYLEQYAGTPLDSGEKAKAYADHYILVHMNEQSQGRTYSQVSGEFMKLNSDPNADKAKVAELGALRQSLFMGSTLRGMLLNAYAFGLMATVALWAAIAAFVGAAVLLGLGVLGLRHARIAGQPVPIEASPGRVGV
ncbi:MAG: hypothetical protein JNL54_00725 [Kineosporiaceae bacterium]|nr:hypothetical protein [Kineosporiaceae bacterium]